MASFSSFGKVQAERAEPIHSDQSSEPRRGKKSQRGFPPAPPEPTSEGHPVLSTAPATRSRTQKAQGCPDSTALLLHTDPTPVSLDPVISSHSYVTLNENATSAGGKVSDEQKRRHSSNTGHTKPSSRSGPALLPSPGSLSPHAPATQPLLHACPTPASSRPGDHRTSASPVRAPAAGGNEEAEVSGPDGKYSASRSLLLRSQEAE